VPRRRLGVALLVPPPIAGEVDGLRRACGDPSLGRVVPHLTLVPPVNVRVERMGEALAVVRAAAAASAPLHLALGPAATFWPDTPVLYLAVGGDLDGVHRLRDAVFAEPLARTLTWPFLPHVTLADGLAPERLAAAVDALADFTAGITVDRLHLMEETRDATGRRVWGPIADAPLGPPAVVGRGGLELALSATLLVDPEAAAATGVAPPRPGAGGRPLVVTGRRRDGVAGVATGWTRDGTAHLTAVAVVPAARGEGVGRHLVAAWRAAATGRGSTVLDASAAAAAGDDVRAFLAAVATVAP
jgi:2'-5' RNA ligase/GNAT superfamily N-acetyltransferase